MTHSEDDGTGRRLLDVLERLLTIQELDVRAALNEASGRLAAVLQTDKVDVFLYEAASDSLVAMGTCATEMGRRQHALGLNRLPLVNGGPQAHAFQRGSAYVTGRADEDPEQSWGIVHGLGIRSEIDVPLDILGERRGLLLAASRERNFFTERDVRFLEAVVGWIGMLIYRAEVFGQAVGEAERRRRELTVAEFARLTPREREIAALVAAGLTNREIATQLVVAEGNVANHLDRIRRKLGLRNRTQIATWAVEYGLFRPGQGCD